MRPLATRCTLQRNLPALTTASGTAGSLGKLQTVKSSVSSYHTQQWIGYRLIFPLQLVEPGTQLQSPATWTTWTTWTSPLCPPQPASHGHTCVATRTSTNDTSALAWSVNGVDDLWRKQNWYRCKWIIRCSSSGLLFFLHVSGSCWISCSQKKQWLVNSKTSLPWRSPINKGRIKCRSSIDQVSIKYPHSKMKCIKMI